MFAGVEGYVVNPSLGVGGEVAGIWASTSLSTIRAKGAIAQHMNLSLKTIQNCVQHLKFKLDIDFMDETDISPRVALCMEAIRRKLLAL